ncbi:hypothetical protein ANN_20932 [Periplaneta americana]|uniref:Uncharacterized protein n=1 Tax=Periplaneta americana TaxID=6978 RepID=A0ABQ8SDZ4_PERAM|nr:hypothetical protein ANN_20932 [Periplaneta americana]
MKRMKMTKKYMEKKMNRTEGENGGEDYEECEDSEKKIEEENIKRIKIVMKKMIEFEAADLECNNKLDNHYTIENDKHRKKSNGYTTYEEVHGIVDTGSLRRIDIITFKPGETKGYILDPTIRFETHQNQPEEVNLETRTIYEPTIPYYKTSYKLRDIEVIGLMMDARGTITKQFVSFCHKFGVPRTTIKEISMIALKSSLQILRRYLYFNSNYS